jgi:hypothetical protein
MMPCGALGFCSLALMAVVTVGVDAKSSVTGSQTEPQDKATKKPEEAPSGFDNKTNGFEEQSAFDHDREAFEETENIEEDGLGPVYKVPLLPIGPILTDGAEYKQASQIDLSP